MKVGARSGMLRSLILVRGMRRRRAGRGGGLATPLQVGSGGGALSVGGGAERKPRLPGLAGFYIPVADLPILGGGGGGVRVIEKASPWEFSY